MKSMSTTSLRRCWLSSHLRSHFPPSRSSLLLAFRRSRLSVVQPNPRTDFVTLRISCGPLRFTIPSSSPSKYSALARWVKDTPLRIRPNSEVQADVDHEDHSLFHKCQELSKVMSFLEKSVRLAQTILLVWQNTYRQLNVVFLRS
jgi:hypothetical protein